jgi:benzoyl-CoA reductase subunit D
MSTYLTAGVDAGASTAKVVIARSDRGRNGVLLGTAVQRIRRRDVALVVRSAFDEALATAGARASDLDYVATTGDAEALELRTGHFYSMTTHARGALFLQPSARAALDIGALHARALRMNDEGRVLAHRMTSQCASGSGQFLENIARYLGVALQDVGTLSESAQAPEKVSSICAVLAETDVINMVSRGISAPDILKGIHLSIAGRLLQLLRAAGADGEVVLTGGLSRDTGLRAALAHVLAEERGKKRPVRPPELSLVSHPDGILAGAIGAALLGAYRKHQLARRTAPATIAARGESP